MGKLRTRYPCRKCLRYNRCEWLLRELRDVVASATLRGMPADEVPEVYIDCEGRYSPPARVLRPK